MLRRFGYSQPDLVKQGSDSDKPSVVGEEESDALSSPDQRVGKDAGKTSTVVATESPYASSTVIEPDVGESDPRQPGCVMIYKDEPVSPAITIASSSFNRSDQPLTDQVVPDVRPAMQTTTLGDDTEIGLSTVVRTEALRIPSIVSAPAVSSYPSQPPVHTQVKEHKSPVATGSSSPVVIPSEQPRVDDTGPAAENGRILPLPALVRQRRRDYTRRFIEKLAFWR